MIGIIIASFLGTIAGYSAGWARQRSKYEKRIKDLWNQFHESSRE